VASPYHIRRNIGVDNWVELLLAFKFTGKMVFFQKNGKKLVKAQP
jgi:hypothetical protein